MKEEKNKHGEARLMKGNEALAEAAIRADIDAYFGYPITPQSEILEYLEREIPNRYGLVIQAESEVASINMLYGGASCGKKVMTSSSSPGISLMQESIGFAVATGTPLVIVDVQRFGPSTGVPSVGLAGDIVVNKRLQKADELRAKGELEGAREEYMEALEELAAVDGVGPTIAAAIRLRRRAGEIRHSVMSPGGSMPSSSGRNSGMSMSSRISTAQTILARPRVGPRLTKTSSPSSGIRGPVKRIFWLRFVLVLQVFDEFTRNT